MTPNHGTMLQGISLSSSFAKSNPQHDNLKIFICIRVENIKVLHSPGFILESDRQGPILVNRYHSHPNRHSAYIIII